MRLLISMLAMAAALLGADATREREGSGNKQQFTVKRGS
jgi:hypothetical protein